MKSAKKKKIADWEKFVAAVAKDQMLVFWKEDGKIVDATRYDATSNNMDIIVEVAMTGKPSNRALDKFEKNTTQEDLQKILDLTDAIMISKR